jgi:N-acetylmuramoyl-L-alanine amidase
MKRLVLLATTIIAAGCTQNQPVSQPLATAPSPAPSVAAAPSPLPPAQPQPSAEVRRAQERLQALGYYNGPIDGLWGAETASAVERFQRERGMEVSGRLNGATQAALRAPPPAANVDIANPTAVRAVQNRLRQLGFYSGPADGVWGGSTQVALERFQRSRGLESTGQLTGATLSAMNIDPSTLPTRSASLAEPLDPAVIRNIQRRLAQLGYHPGRVDGVWGSGSEAALERFQRNRGLEPDGSLNPTTLAALGFDPNNLSAGAVASTAGYGSSTPPR